MNFVVYHIFCVGRYKEIVKSQIERLKSTGLYQWCDKIEVTCIDLENKFEGIDELFQGMGDKVNIFKTDRNYCEFIAIKKVWDLAQEYEGKVFYFHAKGVSNDYRNFITKEKCDWKIEGINIWRNALESHLIDNYPQCINDLEQYDTCGMSLNYSIYWGNFWWANLSYIKNNSEPIETGSRWDYENWIHRYRKTYKSKEYYHHDWISYFTNLPIKTYLDKNFFKNKKIEILNCLWGPIDIQIDEGCPDKYPDIQIDVTDIVKENFEKNDKKRIIFSTNTETFGKLDPNYSNFLLIKLKVDDNIYRICYPNNIFVKLEF